MIAGGDHAPFFQAGRGPSISAIDPEAPASLKEGGVIASGYQSEVDELRSIRDNTKGVLAQLEARLRQETGIPKLKIGYNHVFGQRIEVSNSYNDMVPESYIRKQTLSTGERYITQELKGLESKILGAHERLISLEHRLFAGFWKGSRRSWTASSGASAVAQLDVLDLAQVAAENDYCRPMVDNSDRLEILEGRHPVVEQVLKGAPFVPNDTHLDCDADRCLIITGPNMAGKSTYMRQNGTDRADGADRVLRAGPSTAHIGRGGRDLYRRGSLGRSGQPASRPLWWR